MDLEAELTYYIMVLSDSLRKIKKIKFLNRFAFYGSNVYKNVLMMVLSSILDERRMIQKHVV